MLPRNNTLDIAKGLGIILVVLGHNWIVLSEKGELFRIIFSFHIPLFFFLSGVFLKNSDQSLNFALSKADSLLKPYLTVMVFYGVVKIAAGETTFVKYYVGMLYATGDTIAWGPLWFLPHLFVSVLYSWLILRATEKTNDRTLWRYVIIISQLVIGANFIDIFWQVDLSIYGSLKTLIGETVRLPGLPFSLDVVCISSAFIMLGYQMRHQVKSMKFRLLHFLIAMHVFCILHYSFDETIDLNLRLYGNVAISTLQAISGIYVVISLSALFSKYENVQRPLAYIGSSSLFILIFHLTAQGKTYAFMSRFCEIGYVNISIAIFAGVIFPIILLHITRRQRLLSVMLLPRKYNLTI